MIYPEDFDDDYCQCPRCSGSGEVDCRCGGDLCCCMNYGYQMCPLCYGEGEVSTDVANVYLSKQAEHHAEMMKVWERGEAERQAKSEAQEKDQ